MPAPLYDEVMKLAELPAISVACSRGATLETGARFPTLRERCVGILVTREGTRATVHADCCQGRTWNPVLDTGKVIKAMLDEGYYIQHKRYKIFHQMKDIYWVQIGHGVGEDADFHLAIAKAAGVASGA